MGNVLKIREIGDPTLRIICNDVPVEEIKDSKIQEEIENLKETLAYTIGFGIAASQVGSIKRIIVVGAKKEDEKYNDMEDIPVTAMINPSWEKLSEDTDIQYEGCMSVPSLRGLVKRYREIELSYYDEQGMYITKKICGFFARLIQHECDHLDGVLFLDKVEAKGFATNEMIEKYDLRNHI